MSISIQILCLKFSNVILSTGIEGDWVSEDGNDVVTVIPGKYLQTITPELVDSSMEGSSGVIAYGFQSDKLRELAAMMFRSLTTDELCSMVEIKQMDGFPYKIEGMQYPWITRITCC